MTENKKCLSNESIEILFRIAENGGGVSYSRQDDFKNICSLVDSGHIFQGKSLNTSPSSVFYSITKKGYLALQSNLLWNTDDEVNAPQQVVAQPMIPHLIVPEDARMEEIPSQNVCGSALESAQIVIVD
jgi:hypothetical protein